MSVDSGAEMKIVHVVPSLAKGGGERVVIDLANEQARRGHKVTVLIGRSREGDDTAVVFDPTVETRLLSRAADSRGGLYLALPWWLLRNRDWLRSHDVIHCHLTFGAAFGTLALPFIRRAGRKPIVVETYHAVGMAISASLRRVHAMLASTRDVLVLMASDDYWQEFIRRHPRMRIAHIENGVRSSIGRVGSAEDREAYRHRIGIPRDCRYLVGTVGQLRNDRQPWLHVDVFARMARRLGPDAHFVIAGDGPARGRVEQAIANAGLTGRVTLLGVTPSAAEPASIMDLYVTLAVGPVVGIAALEAMFAQVPTVAIQLDDTYVASDDDLVWSASSPGELAEKAAALLLDQPGLATLAHSQHARAVRQYDVTSVADRYDEVYRSAL